MHQSIDGRRGGHRIFEDSLPFGKDEIAGQQHAMTLVAMGQQGEQDFHLVNGATALRRHSHAPAPVSYDWRACHSGPAAPDRAPSDHLVYQRG